jgi:hypothetical protein
VRIQTRRVTHWQNGKMVLRWMASAFLRVISTQPPLATFNYARDMLVFFTGMFVPFQGQQRNCPIVRFGRVAMMPDEKITNDQVAFDAYFVETFAFGGNSGSPVFFYSSTEDKPVMLAGVMKGYFVDFEPVLSAKSIADTKSASMSQNNSGIAIVVPAEHIRRILHSEALEKSRLAWSDSHRSQVQ